MDNQTIAYLIFGILAVYALFVLIGVKLWAGRITMNSAHIANQLQTFFDENKKQFSNQIDLLKSIDEKLSWIALEPERRERENRRCDDAAELYDAINDTKPDPRLPLMRERAEEIAQWLNDGIKPSEVAKRLNIEGVTGATINGGLWALKPIVKQPD
jgi:hypothetical protein